ncbi:hypothetical protein Pyn_10772 [Prunus yedoensis var. nudiflora]|uniref:Uncharacterized protein n=1 Tax=Prunus yedoensis var. nudiflora TaxID=2094558 RepID=A0A314YP77_PRUYE|nr:hypothetical protein Pyn_10772 [Prunus yedoensis var. nudiflora]
MENASDCRPPSRSASNIAKSLSRDSSPVDVRGLSSARAPRSNQGPSGSRRDISPRISALISKRSSALMRANSQTS